VTRLAQLLSTQRGLSLIWPWLHTAQSILSGRHLIKRPCELLAAISEDMRRRAFRAVQQLGLVCIVPDALVHVRPCAVKVLSQASCSRGAYGNRSAENEVRALVGSQSVCRWHLRCVVFVSGSSHVRL
jgi:hypothetical protein